MPKKDVTVLGQQQRSLDENGQQTNSPMPILSSNRSEVKSELQNLREFSGCKSIDMVEVVRGIYPRYDKYIHSKCENGKEYGIQLRQDAMNALVQRFAPELKKKPKKPNRSKANRIQVRLPDALFEKLQRELDRTGVTMQSFLETLIIKSLSAQEEVARS